MECSILKVDRSCRILLSKDILERAGWVPGDEPLKGWIVVGGPGRCRLLSSAEFEGDKGCLALKAAIDAELDQPTGSAIEFRDDALAVLGVRLIPIEIAPPGPGWRITLPRCLIEITRIRPGESSVALIFFHEHVEIWTLETLRAATAVPLAELT
jgi:hypothetical protein